MKKLCKVVMLPTKPTIGNNLFKYNNQLHYGNTAIMNSDFQHLYLVTDDEIRYSDYAIQKSDDGTQSIVQSDGEGFGTGYCKVVASTDKGLLIPLIPQSFVDAYVKLNGNIKEVKIDVTPIHATWDSKKFNYSNFKITTREDNTVVVSQAITYSKDQVILILNQLYSELTDDTTYDGTFLDNWIDKNLQ